MIVTGPENIFYLTGQQTPGYYTFQALVLPVDGEPAFVVRQLEYFNLVANTFISGAQVYQDGDQPVSFLVNVIKSRGWASKRIAIDKRGWFLPVATYEALRDQLGEIRDGAGIIEQLRIVKSPAELEKIAMAAGYVDAGMRAGLAAIKAGAKRVVMTSSVAATSRPLSEPDSESDETVWTDGDDVSAGAYARSKTIAEKAAWESMVLHFGQGLKSDFLKASHHGRDTGYNLDAVKLVAPLVTFVSVGRKPDTDASSKYRQQCNKVASTRYHGNMELRIHDDGRVEWFVDRNVNN